MVFRVCADHGTGQVILELSGFEISQESFAHRRTVSGNSRPYLLGHGVFRLG